MAVIRTGTVDLKANGEGAKGFLAYPDDDTQHPGLILIQEWYGIEPHIIDLAQKLATEGFITLVPDLYHGKVATEPDDAGKLMMALSQNIEIALNEIQGAIDVLKEVPNVEPKKIGIIGFCMGGLLTYKMLERSHDIGAACPFYGVMYEPNPEAIAHVQAPVMAFFGGRDAYTPPEYIQKIKDAYQNAGKNFEAHVYEHAGHAFINPTHGDGVEDAARDAWPKAVNFLKANLA
jgi:carboxymethylenebutenolidase